MQDDKRCCGSGTCIIDAQGLCWCGQRWNGENMCRPDGMPIPEDALPHDETTASPTAKGAE